MNLIFILFILNISIVIVTAFDSSDNICNAKFCEEYKDSGKCRPINTYCKQNSNNTVFPYPDICNCCDYCLKNLDEGDTCVSGQPGSVSPLEMCGPGLGCAMHSPNNHTCQRIVSDCTKAQDAFDKRIEEGQVGMTEIRPECDSDGFFKPAHCIPGSICYCLSPKGERIFGEMPYLNYEDEQKMTCECSINAWKAQNTLDPAHRIYVARCTEIGTYDSLQCMMGDNANCLCVDSESGSPITDIDVVKEENIHENYPACFDPARHSPGKYTTDCETEFEYYLKYISEQETKPVAGSTVEVPFCQPDGKFARIQSSGNLKICVDPDGWQIRKYGAEIGKPESGNIDCNCARTFWLLKNAGVHELPKCCPNGNFEAWQCRRNECFCVDSNGNQLGLEVGVKDLAKLSCYEGGKPC